MSKSSSKGTSYGTHLKKGGSTYMESIKKAKGLGTSLMFKESSTKPLAPSGSRLAARLSLVVYSIR
jgi:hypothetical protein